jgi:hypothetical protein
MIELSCAGRQVAQYVTRPYLAATLSPRPYLHPVRTRGGIEVTELKPADHAHHLGACVAIPDVGGLNFWGGRTYVRDQGPTWLPNHGIQRHMSWARRAVDCFAEALSWEGPEGGAVLREHREVSAVPAGDHWALDFTFTLYNVAGRVLRIGSPAVNGRPGAGYGGFFWRAPGTSTGVRVFSPDGSGEAGVHGRHADWLALTGTAADGREWSLVFTGDDPWFVRVGEYPGVGSALAWDQPLFLEPGQTLSRRVVTVVADGVLTTAEIDGLVGAAC